jgi:putative ABC transport system permease protein
MLRSYLIVAFRSLRRRMGYSFMNVLGLGTGLACCILIGLWVQDELSYDDFHPKAERTYRFVNTFHMPQVQASIVQTPAALGPTLDESLPTTEHSTRIATRDGLVRQGERQDVEQNILYAEADFTKIFGFDILEGTASLDEPGTVLITPEVREKYFGRSAALGQTLEHDGRELTVTGILASPPSNTHLDYTMVASFASIGADDTQWGYNYFTTYATLQPGANVERFEAQLAETVASRLGESFTSAGVDGKPRQSFTLQPITGIHLGLGAPEDIGSTGSYAYVVLFSGLALFVLLLACINFMNLSTARSSERANEVGVRRAMGAWRGHVASQFLSESFILTVLGFAAAIGISAASLPAFNDLAGKSMSLDVLVAPKALAAYAVLILVVGLLAGSYPAFVLSGFRPVETLRGRSTSSKGSPRLRQVLVVVQFAISIGLIAGTLIVRDQVDYMQSKGLGFDETGVLVVEQARTLQGAIGTPADARAFRQRLSTFKDELRQVSGVRDVASGLSIPGTIFVNSMWALDRADAEPQNFDYTFVSDDYVETLDLQMVAGRDFSSDIATDTAAVVVNESAARKFGFSPEDIIGEAVQRGEWSIEVIGVVDDFHYESLHQEIGAVLLFHEAFRLPEYVAVRIEDGQTARVIEQVRNEWAAFTDVPMTYSFLADELAAEYTSETRMADLFGTLAVLAILIACLGLFGLAAYAVQQRTKEIGIRKALGASMSQILLQLSGSFIALVVLAFIVAAPAAYLAMERWLDQFAYRITVGPATLALAGAVALAIAALTVTAQAWRAAQTNPATALRGE